MKNPDKTMTMSAKRLASIPPVEALGNGEVEIFRARRFLTEAACGEVIRHCNAMRPSTVADGNGDKAFRTSSTCDMDDQIPVARHIRQTIASMLGVPLSRVEPLQAQRYFPGQEFKPHCDWFRPGSDDYELYCSKAGQRTWTAMAYMNNVDQGGETEFPLIGHIQTPEAGTLLLWNNLTSNGQVNPQTLHHARPVVAGSKYVVTLWFRECDW